MHVELARLAIKELDELKTEEGLVSIKGQLVEESE